MIGFEHATAGVLVLFVALLAPTIYYIYRAGGTSLGAVRRIPGITAIEEAVRRAAERGRPVSFSVGLTGVGPVLYACLGVLSFITRRVARFRIPLLLPQNTPEVMAITEDVVREAYRAEGRSDLFDPTCVRFLSDEQFAFAAGYAGMIEREQVGSAFLFGSFAAESLILAEAGQTVGAMQVAATVSPEQVAFFVSACDYTLIGEELFAASAYVTEDPVQVGSLFGQDRAKLVVMAMVIIGSLIATYNSIFPEAMVQNIDSLIRKELWSPQ